MDTIGSKPFTQSHHVEISEPKAPQDDRKIIESKPLEQNNRHQQSLEFAIKIAEKGIDHSRTKQPLEAIAQIVKARDFISAFKDPSVEGFHGHLLFSTYLALIYLGQRIPNLALDVLADAQELLDQCTIIAREVPLVM